MLGQPIERLRTRKTAALMAYLALNAGRTHPREYLAELIWPECDMDSGRHSLNVALSSIRRQIETAGDSPRLLEISRHNVSLLHGAIRTDVGQFELSLQRAAAAESDREAIEHLASAVEVYRGELLSGFYEEWIFPEQHRLHEVYLLALDGLIGRLERLHDYEAALDYALRAVRVDPFRLTAHRDAIRLFLAVGRHEEARRQLAEMKRRLGTDEETDQPDAWDAIAPMAKPAQSGSRRDAGAMLAEASRGGAAGATDVPPVPPPDHGHRHPR